MGDQPYGDSVHLAADGELVRPRKIRRDVEYEINQATAVDVDPLVANQLGVGHGVRSWMFSKGTAQGRTKVKKSKVKV